MESSSLRDTDPEVYWALKKRCLIGCWLSKLRIIGGIKTGNNDLSHWHMNDRPKCGRVT